MPGRVGTVGAALTRTIVSTQIAENVDDRTNR